jgi:hypothetical protein
MYVKQVDPQEHARLVACQHSLMACTGDSTSLSVGREEQASMQCCHHSYRDNQAV